MRRLLLAPALIALALAAAALAAPTLAAPALAVNQPAAGAGMPAPTVNARAYLVMNAVTGDVLMSKNANARLAIASITKLMTVDIALQHLSVDRYVTVSAQAVRAGEESARLRVGERILVGDLVRAALIQSANDAANALADAASGGNRPLFINWMNQEAQDLGLTQTHFMRPDGLDAPRHYSSARDVTRLAQWVMGEPEVREAVRLRRSTISGGRALTSWNDLLGTFPGVVGVKTGHTDDAGWCQVAFYSRGGLRLYATILGSPGRAQRNRDLTALLRYARTRYAPVEVVSAGQPLAKVKTEYGGSSVPVAATSSLVLPLRLDRPLVEKLVLPRTLSLPVKKGRQVGRLRIYANGKLLGERELVALRAVGRPSLSDKIGWYGGQTVHELFDWI